MYTLPFQNRLHFFHTEIISLLFVIVVVNVEVSKAHLKTGLKIKLTLARGTKHLDHLIAFFGLLAGSCLRSRALWHGMMVFQAVASFSVPLSQIWEQGNHEMKSSFTSLSSIYMHLMIVLKMLIKSSWSIQNLSPQNTTFWYIIDFFELKELKKTIDVQSKAFSKSDMSFSLWQRYSQSNSLVMGPLSGKFYRTNWSSCYHRRRPEANTAACGMLIEIIIGSLKGPMHLL